MWFYVCGKFLNMYRPAVHDGFNYTVHDKVSRLCGFSNLELFFGVKLMK